MHYIESTLFNKQRSTARRVMGCESGDLIKSQWSIVMASKANAVKVAASAVAPNAGLDMGAMLALIQQAMAAQAPKAGTAAKDGAAVAPKAVTADKDGDAVRAAIVAAGGKVTRTGKSGKTPKGASKAWIDVTFGGVRIQGNAFLNGK